MSQNPPRCPRKRLRPEAEAMKEGRAHGALGTRLSEEMATITMARVGAECLDNAVANQPFISRGRSLAELRRVTVGESDRAVVVAAGPSLHRNDPVRQLAGADFRGAVVATDSAIRYCLRNGTVPDLVVTLDPHAKRIVRWFGDPHLTQADLEADDYFARQDMDRAFADEMRANEEILELLERHGKGMRIALCTSSSQAVVQRAIDLGMDIYWWNPMLDDPALPDGQTHKLQTMNGLPAVNAGGNVGAACWMMAGEVLDKRHVALVGVDFSYYADTPYRSTQYYTEAVDLVGEENLDSFFIRVFNPHLGKWFYTDPAYHWYRKVFLEMAADASCSTYNCTEGGILFGDNVNFVPLSEFLSAATAGT